MAEDSVRRFRKLRDNRQSMIDAAGEQAPMAAPEDPGLDPRFRQPELPQRPLMDRGQQMALDQFNQRRQAQDEQDLAGDDTPEEFMSPEQLQKKRTLEAIRRRMGG